MDKKTIISLLGILLNTHPFCLGQIEIFDSEHGSLKNNPITEEHIKQVDLMVDSLKAAGILDHPNLLKKQHGKLKFAFPIRIKPDTANGIFSSIVRTGGGFFDHDKTDGILDFMGGRQTYNGHLGTDWSLTPFRWHSMDQDQISVIAAAPGILVSKIDGHYDRACSWTDPLRGAWNGVIIQHSDGSRAWYIHFRKNSLTSKNIGDYIELGEFLGHVGSSGMSAGPHLHFQVMDPGNKAVDPFFGPSNPGLTESMWIEQPPYNDKGMNRLLIGSALPVFQTCPKPEILNEKRSFIPGDSIFFSFYSKWSSQDVFTCRIRQPNGMIQDEIKGTIREVSNWKKKLPNDAAPGLWHYEVVQPEFTYRLSFKVENSIRLPEKVVLHAPIDKSSVHPQSIKFIWQKSSPNPTNYQIEINKNGSLWQSDSSLTDTTYLVTNASIGAAYTWRVKSKNAGGWGEWSNLWTFSTVATTSVPDPNDASLNLTISPNPFHSSALIHWRSSLSDQTSLIILDLTGRKVKTLIDEFKTEGEYRVPFDRSELQAGVYFCQLKVGNYRTLKKIMIFN
jgi:hypothetical protein